MKYFFKNFWSIVLTAYKQAQSKAQSKMQNLLLILLVQLKVMIHLLYLIALFVDIGKPKNII